ncbi:MAG: TRAP transporter large permease subunit, partial [Alphaproteobacteria bacterium]
VVDTLKFDPIWFGILVVVVVEISLLTPPVGLNVFVLRGVLPDVPTGVIFRGVMPFFTVDLVRIAILAAFPIISLWLPSVANIK